MREHWFGAHFPAGSPVVLRGKTLTVLETATPEAGSRFRRVPSFFTDQRAEHMNRNHAAAAIERERHLRTPSHCFQCRAPSLHVRRVTDFDNGDHYDVFKCLACSYVSWMAVTE